MFRLSIIIPFLIVCLGSGGRLNERLNGVLACVAGGVRDDQRTGKDPIKDGQQQNGAKGSV
jgi:hypothetical protein